MTTRDERRKLLEQYGHLYKYKSAGFRNTCVYCGDTQEAIDHCPALSWADALVNSPRLKDKGFLFYKYPCCKQCNRLLRDLPLFRYRERLVYVYNKTQEYLDKAPYWTEEEVEAAELRGELRRMVLARSAHLRKEFFVRIREMEQRILRIDDMEALLEE